MKPSRLQDYFQSLTHEKSQRPALEAKTQPAGKNLLKSSGPVAMQIAQSMGLKDQGRPETYSFERHEYKDSVRLKAENTAAIREIHLYSDNSIIILDVDKIAGKATQNVYSANCMLEHLEAPWNTQKARYSGAFRSLHLAKGQEDKIRKVAEVAETILYKAEICLSDPHERPFFGKYYT